MLQSNRLTQVHSRFRNTPILFSSEDKKSHHLFFLLGPPFLRTVACVSELLLLVLQEGSLKKIYNLQLA